jgi:hypothetical protein
MAGYFEGVVLLALLELPLVPLGVVLELALLPGMAELVLVSVPEPLGALPLTLPEADRLVEPVVLLAVVLGLVVEAVVSVDEVLGVEAVVLGVVVLVVVVLRSQPAMATEARARAATSGISFFMDFSIQGARGLGVRHRAARASEMQQHNACHTL